MKEHYTTLNIMEGASLSEVKKASRRLLLKYHPDLHPTNQLWAEEKTKKILFAYNFLCDTLAENQSSTFINRDGIHKQTTPKIHTVPLMVFSLGSLLFAVTITNVKSITALQALKIVRITNRKGLYPFITGITHYQGTIAPLLDLGNKLNLETSLPKQQVLICEIEDQPLALIIDEGKNVINIEMNDFYNHAHFQESEIPQVYVSNVIINKDKKIHILDLGKLLTH
ncbi:MAG: hypothetical protein A2X42_01485 [Candidatus Margulisbacteria bacterium GWF2_38_17]|nr:MAG: hypothetical protein A2X43_12870 [Candidatus Margulisbacteria bacterium GWD2_39_127]OGI02120.1 MAG: hypothetical protein A2X42_01485 [Candidatus Margulisbacteria bacterium GWF2_38_17]OGI10497.1 MAG: hypothetical protein A2X41_06985 [Candidatus Margulisbacteria bacterium GWE2_39_32]